MFDTKIAMIVRSDLEIWQRLNIVAFLSTGIASAAPDIIGDTYIDANDRLYGKISTQPILIFEAELAQLQEIHRKAIERDLTLIPYVHAMFSTGNDEDNRRVFRAEDPNNLNLVGVALRGPKKLVDKTIKGLKLHH